MPACRSLKPPDIGNVVSLIARTRIREANSRPRAQPLLNPIQKLEQTECILGSAADIECLSGERFDIRNGKEHRIHQVVYEKHVPNLRPISVNCDDLIFERPDHKMSEPTLIFGAELVRPINATHPEDDGRDVIRAREIPYVLIGSAFRAAVWSVEIERTKLIDAGSLVNRLDALRRCPQDDVR
jgi:hypothetical protein